MAASPIFVIPLMRIVYGHSTSARAWMGAAVAVAGVALLTAPQSGKRTRRQITRAAEDAQEHLQELGEELIDKGRELIDQGRGMAKEKLADVRG